jgi:hypothetical protein
MAEGGPSSRYRLLSMPNLGAADNRSLVMMAAVEYGRALARINGLAVVWRSQLMPEWAQWKYAQRRCSSVLGW